MMDFRHSRLPVSPRSLTLLLVCLLALPRLAAGQSVAITQTGPAFELQYTAEFSADELQFGQSRGFDTVSIPDGGYLTEIGKPMLPTAILHVALPAGMTVTGVRVDSHATIDLPGQYCLWPAQPPRPISAADPVAPVPPDAVAYAATEAYPADRAALLGQSDLAGQGFAVVQVCPLQYVAGEQKLILCTSMTVVLKGVDGYICGDFLPANISAAARADFERALTDRVVNPDDVALRIDDNAAPGLRGVAPGDFDYVIITPSNWVSAFQPLADWKTKKGVPAAIVTTEWIYANYTGSTNVDKIRAFVVDAYTNWGTVYFLMGGDTGSVPCQMRTFSSVDSDPVPNDTYYADFDADWVVEVNVGRASVTGTGSTAGGIASFVSKIMTFEKNPPATNYTRRAGFFGFNLDSSTPTEVCKTSISSSYMPGWTMTTVYDSQGGNHKTNVIAALNAGGVLFNHADHSGSDVMGVGYVNHGWMLTNGDMDALTNGPRQGILYSMGCDPCAFDVSACIAEHFVRNASGGGVGFVGNSRYGWYYVGSMNGLSMIYDQYFFRSLVQQNWYKLGAAFTDHKNDYYPGDDYYKYVWTELTLLGDPELPVWTDVPTQLTVSHPASVQAGAPTPFAVEVSSGGTPVSGATVCLSKSGDVYQIGQTNAAGVANFTVTAAAIGTLNVTVTRQNRLPYEGSANVIQVTSYVLTALTDGQGSVTLNPSGGTYSAGTPVQVTAHAATAWHFDHWTGAVIETSNPITIVMDANKLVVAKFGLIGDLNCDGHIDFGDINPFVDYLLNFTLWESTHTDCMSANGDIDQDGTFPSFDDINPFVDLVTAGD